MSSKLEKVVGTLVRIRHQKDEFAIVEVQESEEDVFPSTVLGNITMPKLGMVYEFEGRWTDDPRWGRQFRVKSYVARVPQSTFAIIRYLHDHAAGVGAKRARQIVDTFGDEALIVLKNDPERVAEAISGLSVSAAKRVQKSLLEVEQDEAVELQLRSILEGTGVNKTQRARILATWGGGAYHRIEENPYELTRISGIGWVTADRVAMQMGWPRDSPARIGGGVTHALRELTRQNGDTCLRREELVELAAGMLGVDLGSVDSIIDELAGDKVCIYDAGEHEMVYPPELYYSEVGVSFELRRLASYRGPLQDWTPTDMAGVSDEQKQALRNAYKHPVSVITGGPGTGKTTAVKWLCEMFSKGLMLVAPTGKAARRLGEVTQREVSTIHRALSPVIMDGSWTFLADRHNPLSAKMVVVDESSMVDVKLMYNLLQAIPEGCRLVLVGDADQLPSVQPGNCLRDVIASRLVPVQRLTKVLRQDKGDIIRVCQEINRGRRPRISNKTATDLFHVKSDEDARSVKMIRKLCMTKLGEKFGFSMPNEIQVLSPVNDHGDLSVNSLNLVLQKAYNPDGEKVKGTPMRVGDKVVQKKNDNERGIVNGDVGVIKDYDPIKKQVGVEFQDPPRYVIIPVSDNDLRLAYCMTVHSAQGSEWPCVVIPLSDSFPPKMINRSWAYTAISRASKMCILVGNKGVLGEAASRPDSKRRQTCLAAMLAS